MKVTIPPSRVVSQPPPGALIIIYDKINDDNDNNDNDNDDDDDNDNYNDDDNDDDNDDEKVLKLLLLNLKHDNIHGYIYILNYY